MIQIIKQVYYVFATVALLLIAFFANRADLSVVKMLLLALGLLVHLLMMIQHRSLQYLWKTSYGSKPSYKHSVLVQSNVLSAHKIYSKNFQ